jgi:uncharacterized OsmC-like protein
MSATMQAAKPPPEPRHGVNTPALFATINAVRGQPELAKFQFRAHTRWIRGTHVQSSILGFSGAGGEHTHKAATLTDADHPEVLVGEDHGPTPVEWALHALASCLMAGVANIAAARGVTLQKCEASLSGDMDLRGILGLSDEVRNGFSNIRVEFDVEGDAPAAKLRDIVSQAVARSAMYDMLTNGLPVDVSVKA